VATLGAMKPVLFARCDSFETFGLAPSTFETEGVPVRVWEAIDGAPAPEIDEIGGIVLFGSSYNVEHADDHPFIKEAAEFSRTAIEHGTPVLGICFGAQVLAWALDAEVTKGDVREVGFEPLRLEPEADDDPLLANYVDGDMVFQWHMDTFDLPEGATLLATGDQIYHQAYRVGEVTWGIQFHFEIDDAEIDFWLEEFSKEADLLETWGKSSQQVRAEARSYLDLHQNKGAEVFRRFARIARERSG
jgi:GMP synthase (glutamine-hydrolysing)